MKQFMETWKPISNSEFVQLFEEQYAELGVADRERFDAVRVPAFKATIKRSAQAGDENVFVVARAGDGVLYFDDVEYGFNISRIDSNGKILNRGGSQNTLKEAVQQWLPKSKTT